MERWIRTSSPKESSKHAELSRACSPRSSSAGPQQSSNYSRYNYPASSSAGPRESSECAAGTSYSFEFDNERSAGGRRRKHQQLGKKTRLAGLMFLSLAGVDARGSLEAYQHFSNQDLPYLIADRDTSVPDGENATWCAAECERQAEGCTAFVYYKSENSCTFRNQNDHDIQSALKQSASTHVYMKKDMPAVWFHEHTDALDMLQKLVANNKISATDPTAMALYKNLYNKGQVSMDEGWFSWCFSKLISLLWMLAVVAIVGGVLYLIWTKYGESTQNFVHYKVLLPLGLRKSTPYTPQELAAMWDHDDDGL